MPHFISKNLFTQTNIQHDDFEIKEYLINARFPNIRILPVLWNNEIIFIRCIQRDKPQISFLYKTDKIATSTNLVKLKEILRFIAKDLDVISHNLNQTHAKHTCVETQFLLDHEGLESLRPDYIEVGFGSGRNILDLAMNKKDKIILGFEIHAPSIRQVLNAINLHHLTNLYICNLDARIGIQAIRQSSVKSIIIHFPIPWNKAKHRRVFNRSFLSSSFGILQEGGFVDIRSDDYEFIRDCIDEILSANTAHFEVAKNKNAKIVSKYEQRWHKLQKDIYELRIIKQGQENIESNTESMLFDFPFKVTDLAEFCNKKWVYDSVFISIGDLYQSDSNSLHKISIAQLTLGSFFMPFNTYLVLEDETLHYFKMPFSIKSHHRAHELLCQNLMSKNSVLKG